MRGMPRWPMSMAMMGALACGEAEVDDLFPVDGGISTISPLGGLGGRSGLGGRGATGGRGGLGRAGTSGASSEAGAGGADAGVACDEASCSDDNDCTEDICGAEGCEHVPLEAGVACGSSASDECTQPDACDGEGRCEPNDEPPGAECEGGACAGGDCVSEQPSDCPAAVVAELPFQQSFRTVGGVDLYPSSCDQPNVPDFAVVFTAPVTGTFRFEAEGEVGADDPESGVHDIGSELADSVLTVVDGSCAGAGAEELACNDDFTSGELGSRLDLLLEEGRTVTVYVGELAEPLPGGGSGSVSITLLPD